eukprot:757408-Hanusia_phi.AAC.7
MAAATTPHCRSPIPKQLRHCARKASRASFPGSSLAAGLIESQIATLLYRKLRKLLTPAGMSYLSSAAMTADLDFW